MSGVLSYSEIAMDWRVPGKRIEIRPDRSSQGLVSYPKRTLIVAPKLAAGTGATLTPLRLTRLQEAVVQAGDGSIAAEMAEFFLSNNFTGNVSMMLLPDPAGGAAKAAGSIAFSGTPTAAGSFVRRIGGRRVAIPINVGETATVIGARLAAAIGALPKMPVTAANTTGTVAVTAKHFGTVGNFIPIASEVESPDPAGLVVAVTQPTAGTGEADLDAALDAIATEWWTDLAVPVLSSGYLALLEPELERRQNAMVKLDCRMWGMQPGTFSALSTWGAARNSRFISALGANNSPSTPWAWAAAYAARSHFYLLNDPARQLRGIPLTGILPPISAERFIETERDLLLRDGISTWNATDDGQVVLERGITQNQKTSTGAEDTAWLDVTTGETLSRIRYDWLTYADLTWPRAKLADDDGGIPDYDPEIATPRRIHGSWAGRLKLYERQGWIQDAAGCADKSWFRRNASDRNTVDARYFVNILGNLHNLNGVMEFTQ